MRSVRLHLTSAPFSGGGRTSPTPEAPLLDEAGFASAARWYVEEFAKRSKIDVRLEMPEELPRLMPALELALFRALQESLTNVHHYSGDLTDLLYQAE